MSDERVRVCAESEIEEGKCAVVQAFGRTIAVFRYLGKLHAIDDECPHRFGPISLGMVDEGKAVCPLHNWRFDLVTGEKEGQASVKVDVYPVELDGADVYVRPAVKP